MARDGIELTDNQIAALERKVSDDETRGEIEAVIQGIVIKPDITGNYQIRSELIHVMVLTVTVNAVLKCQAARHFNCYAHQRRRKGPGQ